MGDFVPLEPLPQPLKVEELTPEAEHFKRFKPRWEKQEPGRIMKLAFNPEAPYRLAAVSGTVVKIWGPTESYRDPNLDQTLTKFKDLTQCVAFRSDGKLLLAGEASGSCALVETEAKKVLRRFRGHGDAVTCAAFASTDRSRAATGARDGRLRIWDVVTSELLQTVEAHTDNLKTVCPGSGSADAWITAGYDGKVRLWDLRAPGEGSSSAACVLQLDHGAPVEDGVAFPNGAAFASAGGPTVRIWDLVAGNKQPVQALEEAHSKAVTAVCLDSQASVMLTASFDGFAKIFSTVDMECLFTYRLGGPATCAAWRGDDKAFAVGLEDGRWITRQYKPSKDELRQKKKEFTGDLRGSHKETSVGDEVVETRKRKVTSYPQVDYFLRKYEHKKLIQHMVKKETLPAEGFAIVDELLQRGTLTKAMADLGQELSLEVAAWLESNCFTGDSLQHCLWEEALHSLMDCNKDCFSPPPTQQLENVLYRLEKKLVEEQRMQEMIMETSGMFKCIMSV